MEESAAQFEAMPFLAALTNRISGVLAKMAGIRDGFGRVDAAIAALDAANPDFAKLTSALDGVIADRSQHEAVRAYAEKYRQPCAELAAAKAFVADEFAAINALDFAKVKASADSLALPDKDLCARHPQLSEHRVKMEGHHADAQRLAVNLESMVRGLAEKGVMNGSCEGHLRSALDEGAWRRALSFDCFGTKPPTARRKDPSCLYDALLGVEYTYQSLRALPDDYNGWCLRMIGFSPDVVEARSAMEYVDVFVKFVEERPKWLRRGKLGEFYKYCVSLQESRERIVRFLRSYEGERRAVLVTRLYAGYLKPAEFDLAARRALAADFKALQSEVSDLAEKYGETSDPVAQIGLRTKMLALGLPGDSQLHSKWVQKFEGGDR